MLDTVIRIRGDLILIRRSGVRTVLEDGEHIEIAPAPDLWLLGTYHYDKEHNEHFWQSDDTHFVGLVDGMNVRVHALEQS